MGHNINVVLGYPSFITISRDFWAEQNCTLKYGSWTYDGNMIDIKFFGDETEVDVSEFRSTNPIKVEAWPFTVSPLRTSKKVSLKATVTLSICVLRIIRTQCGKCKKCHRKQPVFLCSVSQIR